MSYYCINPECNYHNIPNFCPDCQTTLKFCHKCGTKLHIKERYRLVRPLRDLNKSPYIDVFEVDDEGTPKVLKVLKSCDQTLLRLFKREAEVLISLKHQGIPAAEADFTFKIPQTQRELHCLVMEKIAGQDLEQFLQQHGSISEDLAINWLKQLATILHQVHRKKLFHRDIKPSNIMLKPDGQLVLIDFGAARWVTQTIVNGDREITKVLTCGYGAPEQENGKAVPQSDFFALGRTFVHLLTGIHPKEISQNNSENQFIWREYARISEPLANFIDELMAPEVENRPSHTKEILQRLDDLQPPESPPSPNPSLFRIDRWVFFLGLPITLLVGIAIGLKIRSPVSEAPTLLSTACNSPALDTSQIAFSPNGKYLVQVSLDETLRVFDTTKLSDASNNEQVEWNDCKLHEDGVVALKFSSDGRKIATAGLDATARLWTMNPDGKINSKKLSHEYADIPDFKPPVVALDFSLDGKYLASASADGIARVWDTHSGRRLAILNTKNYIKAISFSQDKKYLATASLNNSARVWNWQDDNQGQKATSLTSNNLVAVAFSPTDGKYLASANAAGDIQIWDTTTFKAVAKVTLDTYPMAIAFSPNGKSLVTIGLEDNKAVVWNWKNHKNDNLTIPLRHNDEDNLVAVAFPVDKNYVATASTDGTINLWNIDKGDRLTTCNSAKGLVAIALSPQNSNLLATANADGKVNIFECKPN